MKDATMDELELLRRADPAPPHKVGGKEPPPGALASILRGDRERLERGRGSESHRDLLVASVAAVVGVLVVLLAVTAPTHSLSHPAGPVAVQVEAIRNDLPGGLRAAAADPVTGTLWVLTRADANNSVRLTRVTDAAGPTRVLSNQGQDWAGGAVVLNAGLVWAAWGAHLVSFDARSGKIDSVAVPWRDAGDGQTGRAIAAGASGACVWVAVIGEHQVRCYNPDARQWSSVPTPAQAAVSASTRMASSRERTLVNLGPASARPTVSIDNHTIAWAPSNSIPVSDPSTQTVAAVSDRAVALLKGSNQTVTSLPPTRQPALDTPTLMRGSTLIRVFEADGALIVDRVNIATGATTQLSAALPRLTVTPHYAPPGSTPRVGWTAPKVEATALGVDDTLWVVTTYPGTSPPSGWGALVGIPNPK